MASCATAAVLHWCAREHKHAADDAGVEHDVRGGAVVQDRVELCEGGNDRGQGETTCDRGGGR